MVYRFSWIASFMMGASLLAAPLAAQPVTDFTIEPGKRAGFITRDMTEARLRALLPKGQVRRALRNVGEGNFECGTEIFAGRENEAFVSWGTMTKTYEEDNPKTLRACRNRPSASKPQAITVERHFDKPAQATAWRTNNGIRVGMTIRELEKVLGEPFDVSVCLCDTGGVILDTGGERKPLAGIGLLIDFSSAPLGTLKPFIREEDDHALKSSDVPEALAKHFVVYRLTVSLEE